MSSVVTDAARRHPVPDGALTFEPSHRWVRATVGETTVVDSHAPVLVWEPGLAVPLYAFPAADVRTDLLSETASRPERDHAGAASYFDLVIEGERRPLAAWSYESGELAGLIAFDWFRRASPGIEHWYEEEEEIFVHPRDPYKRVDPIPSSRHVTVSINGVVVADTQRPVLLYETRLPTRYYIPPEDVNFALLTETAAQTRCPYKGIARYWSFTGGIEPVQDIVWSYPEPIPAAIAIKDHLAFYNEFVDITVDGEPELRPVSEFSAQR